MMGSESGIRYAGPLKLIGKSGAPPRLSKRFNLKKRAIVSSISILQFGCQLVTSAYKRSESQGNLSVCRRRVRMGAGRGTTISLPGTPNEEPKWSLRKNRNLQTVFRKIQSFLRKSRTSGNCLFLEVWELSVSRGWTRAAEPPASSARDRMQQAPRLATTSCLRVAQRPRSDRSTIQCARP